MNMKDTLARVLDSTQQLFATDENAEESDRQMDAITLLKRDHREVEALFKEVLSDESDALTKHRKTIDRIVYALELHARAEETLFYPAIQQKTKRDTEDRQRVLEAVEEHGSMKDLIRKIKRSVGRDDTLRAKVQVLSEIVEHHVKEEESSLFDEAKRLLGDKKLLALGAEISKLKARAERGRSSKVAGPKRKAALDRSSRPRTTKKNARSTK